MIRRGAEKCLIADYVPFALSWSSISHRRRSNNRGLGTCIFIIIECRYPMGRIVGDCGEVSARTSQPSGKMPAQRVQQDDSAAARQVFTVVRVRRRPSLTFAGLFRAGVYRSAPVL